MALAPYTRIGSYEILDSLGAGGMGEVYRAKDSKLKREVALKVLPADVANDRERMARFQREAEVLASLNHPHIAQIYGLEDNVLVMELVEGEDLAERLKRGAIPLDEALPIAKQIAEALDRSEGDGLSRRPADAEASALQTITSPAMTMRGMILGTAAYMSPEQAKGKAVDRRTDLWAFGAVLYEMLTGRRPFDGEDVTEIIVQVVSREPDWSAIPAATPVGVQRLLRRCLEKDRKRRLDSAAAARFELDDVTPAAETRAVVRSTRLPWMVAAVATIGAGLVGIIAFGGSREPLTPDPAD